MKQIMFKVNGEERVLDSHPMTRLLDVLRDEIGLTGTKEGCGEGECGACSVLINGEVVNSCLVPIAQVQGSEIVTIEGIQLSEDEMHPAQKAFLAHGGALSRTRHWRQRRHLQRRQFRPAPPASLS